MHRYLLILGLVTAAASAGSAQSRTEIAWEPLAFASPAGEQVQAERGWLTVPERHAMPAGPSIRIPVLRLRATRPNPGPPIVWLAGGPGESGLRRVIGSYPLFEALRPYGDVIAFDQRGTGVAEPSLAVPGTLALPSDQPVDSSATRARLAAVGETIRDTIRSRGIELAAYNTQESADDVDALRRALGVGQVVLYGHSYGTHLGLAVIRRHGSGVQRAILAGVNGLGDRWREPARGDEWLARVGEAVRADPAPGAPALDFVAQVRRVLASLDREPIVVQRPDGNVLIGKAEVQLLVTLRSGDLEFVQNLPSLFAALERRDRVDEIATAVQQGFRQRPIGTAMTYAMHVASGVSPERRSAIAAQTPGALLGNGINLGIGDDAFVRALGVPDLGDAFRAPFRSPVPVLLLSGALDGRTSIAEANDVARQFDQAAHIVIDGASHDFLFRRPPPGLSEAVLAFLSGERVRDMRLVAPVSFRRPN